MNPEEVTRLWQRLIAVENKLQSYDTYFSSVRSQCEALEKSRDNHGVRISVLEEARRNQIKLNTQLLESTKKPEVKRSWFGR